MVPADGVTGPVPLLGLAEVLEGALFPPVAPWARAAFTGLFNSSEPVVPPLSSRIPHCHRDLWPVAVEGYRGSLYEFGGGHFCSSRQRGCIRTAGCR
jgi:hypothetical protein